MVDFKFYSELGGEPGKLGMSTVEFFRVWKFFGAEDRESSRWRSSGNGDRDGRGRGSSRDIEVEFKPGYLLFKVVDGFIGGGKLCTSGIPLEADTSDKDGDLVK